jgi:hypothetical protein
VRGFTVDHGECSCGGHVEVASHRSVITHLIIFSLHLSLSDSLSLMRGAGSGTSSTVSVMFLC